VKKKKATEKQKTDSDTSTHLGFFENLLLLLFSQRTSM